MAGYRPLRDDEVVIPLDAPGGSYTTMSPNQTSAGAFRPLAPGEQINPLDAPPPPSAPVPDQMGGFMRYPAMAASELTKGALIGSGAIGDLDSFLHRQFTRGIFDPLHRMVTGQPATRALEAAGVPQFQTGLTSPVTGQPQELPPGTVTDPLTGKPATDPLGQLAGGGLTSTNLLAGGQAAGVVDRPELTPNTTGEKYLAAGSQGVGSTLPYLWMGGLNPASIGRGVTQGVTAGTAGEWGAQTFPEYAGPARAIASLGGLALGGKAFDLGSRGVAAARGATTPALDAYRNLGIDPTLAGDVTGSPFMQQIQSYGAKSLGGSGRVQAAGERAVGQWRDALEETAFGYGGNPGTGYRGATTLQEAGTTLQRESLGWLNRWRQAQVNAEQAVSARIPATAAVDLAPVNQVLQGATTKMPGLPSVAEIHTTPTFKKLQAALATDAPGGRATWADAQAWRSQVGDELEQSLLSRDGNQAAWRQLYGALSRSLGDTAFANNAHREWAAANTITSQGHQFVENVAGKFINARNPASNTITEEAAAVAALRGSNQGGSTLEAIRREMPAAADDLAAFKLRDAATARLQNAAGTEVSPRTLVSNLSPRALAPEARDALFASDPDLARRVNDLATIGERMRRTEQFANTSNTATNLGTAGALAGLIASPYTALQAYQQGGGKAALAALLGTAGAPYLPGYIAGRATTSPSLTRFLATPMPQGAPTGLERLLGGPALYPQLPYTDQFLPDPRQRRLP